MKPTQKLESIKTDMVDDEKTPIRLDDPILNIFLTRLETKLRENKLTKSRLAENLGLSRNAISQFFLRKRRPNVETLVKIANELAVSVDFLIGRSDESKVEDLLRHERVIELVEGFVKLPTDDQKRLMDFLRAMLQSKKTAQ